MNAGVRAPAILDDKIWFPDPATAPRRGPRAGLVAVGGDFTVERLLLAYRSGIFPWTENPITWWSPDPRGVIPLDALHVSRSLARFLRKNPYRTTINTAFEAVMMGCSEPSANRGNTWITPGFLKAYRQLHEAGYAHSVECWLGENLVGGIYGVHFGKVFAGESMFHRADNASKVALVTLVERLRSRGFGLFDVQMVTAATEAMGAVEISRDEYLHRLKSLRDETVPFI